MIKIEKGNNMSKLKIAYSGIEGAFAYISAKHIFPNEELISFQNFQETYDSVVKDECDYAVIPIDNSYSGEVPQVMDLLFYGDLYIKGIYSLPVVQNLLGLPDSDESMIKRVVSHPKALEQCDQYITDHGFVITEATNTARAAKEVADLGDNTVAAIASKETAELYGLKVLREAINESDDNTTRFLVLSKEIGRVSNTDERDSFIMLFSVPNESGALVKALQIIGEYGFNMKVVHSRPLKNYIWQYYFYVEIEGEYGNENGVKMLEKLEKECSIVKVLGPSK